MRPKIAKSSLHRIVHCTGSGRIRWYAESSTGRTGHRIRENQYQAGHQTGPDSAEYRFGNVAPDRTGHRIGLGRISTGPDRPDPEGAGDRAGHLTGPDRAFRSVSQIDTGPDRPDRLRHPWDF